MPTQMLHKLSCDPTTKHIPIVALSANATPSDIKKGLHAGFFEYLTKPVKITEFTDSLNRALKFAQENLSRHK